MSPLATAASMVAFAELWIADTSVARGTPSCEAAAVTSFEVLTPPALSPPPPGPQFVAAAAAPTVNSAATRTSTETIVFFIGPPRRMDNWTPRMQTTGDQKRLGIR